MKRRFEPAVKPLVCVLGGSGFVGGHLAALLTAHGYRVRIPTRRATRHAALRVLPGVDLVETDIHDAAALREVLRGCTAAVNLVAILNEGHAGDFQRVHVELPRRLAALCREGGVRRLLHMSALNADAARGTSRYLRTKGEGEDLMHQAEGLQVTSFRPSVIFGPGDHLFNRFARLLKLSPIMPLACPQARFAPVFVGDVAQAMRAALEDTHTIGQRYDLCGPRVYTLRELVEYTARVLRLRRRCVVGLGPGLSRLQAAVLGHLPGKAFTYDNYLSLQTDAVCGGPFPAIFGIVPAAVETQAPLYLRHHDLGGRMDEYRRRARHG
jgi:NADH dehydrogenase